MLQTISMLATNKYMKKRRIGMCKYHPLFYNLIQPWALELEITMKCKVFYINVE